MCFGGSPSTPRFQPPSIPEPPKPALQQYSADELRRKRKAGLAGTNATGGMGLLGSVPTASPAAGGNSLLGQ